MTQSKEKSNIVVKVNPVVWANSVEEIEVKYSVRIQARKQSYNKWYNILVQTITKGGDPRQNP